MTVEWVIEKLQNYLILKKSNYYRKSIGSNQVYSILKRYKERLQRLEFINKEYEMVWSRMKIKYALK